MDICICKYIHMYVRDSFDVPLFVMVTRRQTRFTRSLPWLLVNIWTLTLSFRLWVGRCVENGF